MEQNLLGHTDTDHKHSLFSRHYYGLLLYIATND
jgi:hypothetical protein